MFAKFCSLAWIMLACICLSAVGVFGVTDANADKYREARSVDREFRFGVLYHEDSRFKRVMGIQDDAREGSVADINLELLVGRLNGDTGHAVLDFFLSPRFRFGGSINLDGGTSHGSIGLAWDHYLTDRIFFESSLSIAVHDGYTGNRNVRARKLGCNPIGHQSASLGADVSDRWRVMLTVEHLDNFGLCHENAGLTNIGVRAGLQF